MTRRSIAIIVCALSILCLVEAQSPEPRVIMISIDGLMPSAYTSAATESQTPNLRRLAQRGVWAEGVIGVLPTVTYPSHTTLITGVDPSVHGIYDNQIFDPENKSDGAWFWYARSIKVPTLPMAARARGLRAAAVTWPVTIGMDLDYLAPEYHGLQTRRKPEHAADAVGAANAPGRGRDRSRQTVRLAAERSRPHRPDDLHHQDVRSARAAASLDRARRRATLLSDRDLQRH